MAETFFEVIGRFSSKSARFDLLFAPTAGILGAADQDSRLPEKIVDFEEFCFKDFFMTRQNFP